MCRSGVVTEFTVGAPPFATTVKSTLATPPSPWDETEFTLVCASTMTLSVSEDDVRRMPVAVRHLAIAGEVRFARAGKAVESMFVLSHLTRLLAR